MNYQKEVHKANRINLILAVSLLGIIVLTRGIILGLELKQAVMYFGMVCILVLVYGGLRFIDSHFVGVIPMLFGVFGVLRIYGEGYTPEIQAFILSSLIMATLYLSKKCIILQGLVIDGMLIFVLFYSRGEVFHSYILRNELPAFIPYVLTFNIGVILAFFVVARVKSLMQNLDNQINTTNFSCKELCIVEEELQKKYNELESTNFQLRNMIERFNMVTEASNEAIYEWQVGGGMIFHSEKLYEILGLEKGVGLTRDALIGVVHPFEKDRLIEEFREMVGESKPFFRKIRLKGNGTSDKWILLKAIFRIDESGSAYNMIGSVADITTEKQSELTIQRLAFTDSVTGLPNREAILRKNEELNSQGYNGILIIGLLNFSDINANYGYEAGDGILKGIGARLSERLPETIVSRLRASDFAILVKYGLAGVQRALDSLHEIFNEPFMIGPKEVHLKYNVGAALSGIHGEGYEIILKRANLALLEARRGGYEGVRIFEKNLESFYEERISMENDFRHAVLDGDIKVVFQPKYRTKGPLYGFEALARWNRGGRGNISPEIFIGLAEETGLIIEMGLLVAKKACEFLSELLIKNIKPDGNVSINISPVQLAESDFVEKFCEVVRKTGIDPGHVGLEITESVFIGNKGSVINKLEQLREKGFKIYLDDFGKDYSNFSYLEDLPLDYIKIDKEFIKRLENTGNSRIIVKSIIDLTHSLGCRVVAEGVETDMQLELLKDLDCDFIQGFLRGRPSERTDALSIAKIG